MPSDPGQGAKKHLEPRPTTAGADPSFVSGTAGMSVGSLIALVIALLSTAAAMIHLNVAGQHSDHRLIAASFLAIALAQLAFAGAIVFNNGAVPRRLMLAGAGLTTTIIAIWAFTRIAAFPFIPGLEARQEIGINDAIATTFELVLLAGSGLFLALPQTASRTIVPTANRALSVAAAAAILLLVPGLVVPHDNDHRGRHAHGDVAVAAHAEDRQGHDHDAPLSFEEARAALAPHRHGDAPSDVTAAGGGAHLRGHERQTGHHHRAADGGSAHRDHAGGGDAHGHPDTGGEATCPPGTKRDTTGGMHGDKTECVVLGSADSDWRLAYEPADEKQGAAIRGWYDDGSTSHHHDSGHGCRPTAEQQAFGDWLVSESRRALRERYLNDPWQALADGFIAYPIPSSKWFHLVHVGRINDGPYVAPKTATGDPRSRVFNPSYVESFLYGVTDEGLTPLGAMYILPNEYKGWAPQKLPNPTGCLLQWHNHTGGEGLVTSFDARNPDQSLWMSHVWTHGGLDPWGDDYDGSEPHAWFAGFRHIPALCNAEGTCL